MDKFADFAVEYASSRGICFIEPQLYTITFFIIPTLVLISINIICFIMTTYEIQQARPNETDIATISDSKLAKIFAKIGGLMGVTWLFALVPFLTKIEELWFVFVLLNGLQGLSIFIVSGIPTVFMKKCSRRSVEVTETSSHRTVTSTSM